MKKADCFIKPLLFAESKDISSRSRKSNVNFLGNRLKEEKGGGFGVLLTGLAIIFLALIILINIADYSLFTYKRNLVSKAMDYAVTAAVQQISKSKSTETGLANGFDEETGEKIQYGIEIDIDSAVKTFCNVFYQNYKGNIELDKNLLICVTSSYNNKLKYSIKAVSDSAITGELEAPMLLEDKINQAIERYWGTYSNTKSIYINGNPKTNTIEKGTYVFAYISDFEIKALYSKRKTSISYFAGAKIQRQ